MEIAGVKRKATTALIVYLMLGTVSGCDFLGIGARANGKDAVRQNLRLPKSATFRNVYIAEDHPLKMVCGEVNSRNRYGDYTGYQRFYSDGAPENTYLENTSSEFSIYWKKYCE